MALVTDTGVYGAGGEIMQPKQKNRFRVKFNGIGDGGDTDGLTLQAITVDRPKLGFEEVQLDRYNSRAYIAGKHTFEPINITFEDDISGRATTIVQRQLEKQQHLVAVTPAAMMGAAKAGADYKFSMNIVMLDGDHTPGGQPYEEWIVEGAYISNVDYTDLDYSTAETVKITLTIRYDHARQSITGSGGLATGGMGQVTNG